MKKYSIISSLIFIVLTFIFYEIPRTEIESVFIEQKQTSTNPVLTDWYIKTSHKDFYSPTRLPSNLDKAIFLGQEILGNDIVYIRYNHEKITETIFIKGIHSKDYSYLLICLLMGLQFFILIGMTEKKEALFLNAFCIFLIAIQLLYMLRLVFI